ncbi:MAG: 3-deoxy-D-manno-octulosonic acid transferase [Chthoniobacterales bacterium]|nr:3-deoxy-D-manno-octulosonic acid transferase [Chthoniobacterales bacterium]
MIRLLYNLLFPFALLLFLPAYLLKMRRRGNYRRNFGQRFGIYSAEVRARLAQQNPIWIHAVSVGEVAIALKLAAKLRELQPAFECVLTTTTTTGFAFAEKEAQPWMLVMYNPLDFWPVVQRAFGAIRPRQIILVEAEVWPNLAATTRARGIPIALVNARLSPRSERRFRRFRRIVAPTFRCLDLVCVQELEDVARWAALGIPRERIHPVGSIKYDPTEAQNASSAPAAALQKFGIDPAEQLILFGGSTHPGEEEILAQVFLRLRTEFPSLKLIIAPRHVERTRDIRTQLAQLHLQVLLRSGTPSPFDCLLLDTTGELRNWYSVATVVFIGKSLTTNGGQNPVEPILAGKPVVFGPHMENFARLAQSLVAHDAALQVPDAEALARHCGDLLRDAAARQRLVANAERVLACHRGATDRTAELLMSLKARSQTRP